MFSVVIATRDRPELLARALRSVAAQQWRDMEVVLVDDSRSADARAQAAALLQQGLPCTKLLALPATEAGHGPGRARNHGMAQASQPYVAFLDDDDEWIDPDYLSAAASIIRRLDLDLHFADQEAIRPDGSRVAGPVWSEDLAVIAETAGAPQTDGTFVLSRAQAMLSQGFPHLNTVVVRRALAWQQLQGFDDSIAYEEDRDFFLRAVDGAASIGYTPRLVARHHVPMQRASASSLSVDEKENCRLRVLRKGIETAGTASVRERCRRDRAYTYKKMSARAAEAGEFAVALRHGRAAQADQFGIKWALYLAGLRVRSAFSRRSQAG